jgi:hypothetical protein
MIYRILYNKQEIYGPDLDQAVLNPVLEVELNSAGKLEFTLPVTRSTTIDPETGEKEYPDDIWKTIQVFSGEIEVWEEDDCIFYGRPLQIIRDWNNQKKVVCEGALAYFNDSVQPTHEYEKSNTVLYKDDDYPNSSGFFNKLIDKHNNQLEKDDANSTTRRFKVGTVDVENSKVYRKTDFETTAECLQSMCLDTNGGYFLLRKEYDDEDQDYVNVIDWRKAAPYGTSQSIDFGINLLDITQDLNGSDLCTVLYPTAGDDIFVDYATKYTEENPYEVKDDLNNVTGHILHEARAEKYITHLEGYKKYGRIVKVKDFDITEIDDSDPDYQHKNSQALFKKAAKWLNDQNQEELTIECSAADIHYLSHIEDYADKEKLKLGQMVQVTDEVHGVVRELPIYKMSMNLDSGIKKITLGTPPKKELTDIVKTSTSSSTRGSSGSKGGGSSDTGGSGSGGTSVDIPVTDVKVKKPGATKYKSVVDNKVAKIDLTNIGGGTVTDVQIDSVSIVDQYGVADIDSSQFGVPVEANPSETATDDLDTIKIGNTVYDIPSSGGGSGVTVNDLYDACVANNVTPESHSLNDIVACFLTGGGGGKTQINPFPSGASTITFYHSNGVTITTSTIAADGTGSVSFSESSAGYEGFVIELNVDPGYTYEIEFDYQNVNCEYFVNQYMLGYLLESTPRTDYSRYTEWQNNIERISTIQHFKTASFAIGTKLYLNFNVCGYSDSRTNYAALTNLKVYKMS